MKSTPEQAAIISHIKSNDGLVKVNAVAGSGKTTLLVAIARTLEKQSSSFSGLYLAYNKSVATEAQLRFPSSVKCCTTHSLAYRPTVIEHKLKLGFFNYRSIPEKLRYDQKVAIVDHIKAFCLSSHIEIDSYAKEYDLPDKTVKLMAKYLSAMQEGKIDCTHDFYLKYFHILLATGHLEYPTLDLIAIDEAGDLNQVTLAIFNLLPARKKIMVGDRGQNIYQFNYTINCFEEMKDVGTSFPMTQSFRVAAPIASRIESFCQKYMDPTMEFKGIPIENSQIKTRAYIARTNSALIGKMIELNQLGIQYGLTRTAKQIFELPLSLCNLRHRGFIPAAEFKFLQEDIDTYFEDHEIRSTYKTPLSYLAALHKEDTGLQYAIKLLLRYGKPAIIKCYEEAKKHEKANQSYMLGTAHSMKGLEYDSVTIAPDLNEAVSPILDLINSGVYPDLMSAEARAEINLYYVACSRARVELNDAFKL